MELDDGGVVGDDIPEAGQGARRPRRLTTDGIDVYIEQPSDKGLKDGVNRSDNDESASRTPGYSDKTCPSRAMAIGPRTVTARATTINNV